MAKHETPAPKLQRRTVHLGAEYPAAKKHAKALGRPWTAGALIRETLARCMDGVVASIRAAKV